MANFGLHAQPRQAAAPVVVNNPLGDALLKQVIAMGTIGKVGGDWDGLQEGIEVGVSRHTGNPSLATNAHQVELRLQADQFGVLDKSQRPFITIDNPELRSGVLNTFLLSLSDRVLMQGHLYGLAQSLKSQEWVGPGNFMAMNELCSIADVAFNERSTLDTWQFASGLSEGACVFLGNDFKIRLGADGQFTVTDEHQHTPVAEDSPQYEQALQRLCQCFPNIEQAQHIAQEAARANQLQQRN